MDEKNQKSEKVPGSYLFRNKNRNATHDIKNCIRREAGIPENDKDIKQVFLSGTKVPGDHGGRLGDKNIVRGTAQTEQALEKLYTFLLDFCSDSVIVFIEQGNKLPQAVQIGVYGKHCHKW